MKGINIITDHLNKNSNGFYMIKQPNFSFWYMY